MVGAEDGHKRVFNSSFEAPGDPTDSQAVTAAATPAPLGTKRGGMCKSPPPSYAPTHQGEAGIPMVSHSFRPPHHASRKWSYYDDLVYFLWSDDKLQAHWMKRRKKK